MTGTATQRQFNCTPNSTGTKQGTVKVDGKTLFNFTVNVLPPPPTVSSVSPLIAILNQSTMFTVEGSNLPNTTAFWIDECEDVTLLTGGTSTQRQFQCTPKTVGTKQIVVKDKQDGKVLFDSTIEVSSPPQTVCTPTIVYINEEIIPSNAIIEEGQDITHKWFVKNTSDCDAVNYHLGVYETKQNGGIYSNSQLSGIYPPFTLNAGQTGWIEAKFTLQDSGDFKIWVDIIDEKNEPLPTLSGGRLWTEFTVIQENISPSFEVSPLTVMLGQLTIFTVKGSNLSDMTAFWIDQCEDVTLLTGGTSTQRQFQCTPSWSIGTKQGVVKDKSGGNTLFFDFEVDVSSVPQTVCTPTIVYINEETIPSNAVIEEGQNITHKWFVKNTSNCDAVNYHLGVYEVKQNGNTYSGSQLSGVYPSFTLNAGQTGWIEANFTLQDPGNFKIWVDIFNEDDEPLPTLSGGRLWTEFTVTQENISPSFEVLPLTAKIGESTVFTIRGKNLPNSTAFWIAECAYLTNLGGTATQWQFSCTPRYSTGVKEGVVKDQPGGTLLHSFTVIVK